MRTSVYGAAAPDRKGLKSAPYTGTMISRDMSVQKAENELKVLVIQEIQTSTIGWDGLGATLSAYYLLEHQWF